ncbi:MAG: prepilin-type N-terminal cleavage/methylation domain-containing protein [Acidimicrobiales bacterium]
MLNALKARIGREDREEGFTLIELMVVVLIIAILLAIAIPTFLGARDTANARAAQSNLRNALTAEKTLYTDTQAYSDVSATMAGVENSLTWVNVAPANTGNQVGVVATDSGNTITLTSSGKDNNCYWIQDSAVVDAGAATAGTTYVKATGACGAPTATLPTAGAGIFVGSTTIAAKW